MEFKTKTMKLRDARANLSYIVEDVDQNNFTYVITTRNKPKAVLIDYKRAKKLFPGEIKENKTIDIENTELFDEVMKIVKRMPKSNDPGLKTLSNDIDKILYGK